MTCPLCGGPLHLEQDDRFACERGHAMNAAEFRAAATARISIAFWMAIEALDTEAAALRALAAAGDADRSLMKAAEQAARDATLLREHAAAHVPDAHSGDGRQ